MGVSRGSNYMPIMNAMQIGIVREIEIAYLHNEFQEVATFVNIDVINMFRKRAALNVLQYA